MEEKNIFTREELYELVWTIPITKLAEKFGYSDVGFAKACSKHKIPRPPRGHWAKLEFGKASPRIPLPPCSDRDLQRVVLEKPAPHTRVDSEEPKHLRDRMPTDIQELYDKAKRLPRIHVSKTLKGLHPSLDHTNRCIQEVLKRPAYSYEPIFQLRSDDRNAPFQIMVARESATRALLLFDALIRAVEALGGTIESKRKQHHHYYRRDFETVVKLAGEDATTLRLRESYKMIEKKGPSSFLDRTKVPTGILMFDLGASSYAPKVIGRDTADTRLEDCINDIVVRLVELVAKARHERLAREAAVKRREEEKRQFEMRVAEAKKEYDVLKAKQDKERSRVKSLLRQARNWKRAQRLRHYIEEIGKDPERRNSARWQRDGSFDCWKKWANEQADRLDPLTKSPPFNSRYGITRNT